MINYKINELRSDQEYILKDMLYEAIYQKDENTPLSKEIINLPEISIYIDNWGLPDDICYVAEVEDNIVGAVWTRILAGKIKGYGNIDSETPEFAIALFKEYRNQGIGTALMQRMIERLKKQGYKQTSLSVAKDNYAFKLYNKVGFEIIAETDEDYLMVLLLTSNTAVSGVCI